MIDRRTFVAGAIAAPALLGYGRAEALGSDALFTLGVASGEPTPDGAVLWTRLAPRPLQGDGGMPARPAAVRWEVYADENGRHMVRAGTALADPHLGHSVHVEVRGLASGRPYWYRFFADGQASPRGRLQTAPSPGAAVDRLRFVFASCQKYEMAHYGAWANAVADDPDLIFFLGDYIYEADPGRGVLRPHLNPEPVDLAGYRVRYATYRLDPLLQAAHAAAPWLVTWDDHEVANNYAALLDEDNGDPALFRRRRAAAYQAYYEFMPLRPAARPRGSAMRLYRALDWGRLARFQIVDDRQYRDTRACQPPELRAEHRRALDLVHPCPELADPRRSILGAEQERWLLDELAKTRATWNVLAQQTQMTPYPRRDPDRPDGPQDLHGTDTWEGYPHGRERIFARWQDARTPNPLVIGGDIHAFVASELRHRGRAVAPSFIGGSIATPAGDRLLNRNVADLPGYRFADNTVRGYGRADLTQQRAEVTFRAIRDPRDPQTRADDLAHFVVESGQPVITG